jgi:glycosyltransferase involved in cell wall biosynthesis
MNIIIEGSVFDDKRTGVARFVKNILEVWGRYYKENIYLMIKRDNNFDCISEDVGINYIVVPWWQKRNLIWQQIAVPTVVKRIGGDVYFAPNYTLPLRLNMKSVLIIHDLSFFHYRSVSIIKDTILRYLVRQSCKKADAVIVPTYYIKDEMARHFGQNLLGKIRVMNAACDHLNYDRINIKDVNNVREKYQLMGRYILSVGLLFNRRHPEKLLEAFSIVRRIYGNVKLVIIGGNRTSPYINIEGLINKLKLSEVVIWKDYVPEDELMALYKGCDVFVYLSDYEGFGIPILEALAAQKSVVCSDIGVFRELYFGACKFVDNKDAKLIAERIIEALEKPILRDNIEKCVAKFSWEKSAKNLMKIIEELAK